MDTNLLDTHNRLVADVIAHFRTLTMLATIQTEAAERQIDPQTIAVTGLSMQMEFEGLNTSIKDLLALSRRLKELWLFGRLGGEDDLAKQQAETLEQDVVRCAELVNSIQAHRYGQIAAENGGELKSVAATGEAQIGLAAGDAPRGSATPSNLTGPSTAPPAANLP
ncbi:hypothetical protein B0T11DRAFT_268618 [Plectosphaerella cucumerina]|uniref:Uncharacterized protein n=1 Tax=Plectosphaerella cucumerina TaxID=40658 RepID=A0A8K0TRR2_9PEZI|nr:hypothetical protein B0T11DRAFT_268618 [Plectosphaerella cucumerina]